MSRSSLLVSQTDPVPGGYLRLIVLLGVVIVAGLSGCGSAEPDGHQRMVERLSVIREDAKQHHPYLGDAQLKQGAQTLAVLPEDAIEARFQTQWMLAYHLARANRLQESLAMFAETRELLDKIRARLTPQQTEQFLLHMAATNLRLGETENCIHCRTGESCVLPLKGGGVHQHRGGTEAAATILAGLLEGNPDHLTARWLLNITAMALGRYPDGVPEQFRISPDRFQSTVEFPRFENIAQQLGVDAFNLCGGTIIDDFDGDGYLDVFTTSWDTSDEAMLFRNRGDGTFEKRIETAGLSGILGGLNVIQADYDNDDDIDVLVLRGGWLDAEGNHPNSLLQNDGTGRFHDVTFETGLGKFSFPTQTAAWADFNNDGHLDLYVGNESGPSRLMVNDGRGKFQDIGFAAGVTNDRFAKGVVWGDYNNDRFADLYVSNYQQENRLYRNNKDGTFTDVATELGVAAPVNSFPAWFWDYNNDGQLDLYVSSWWPDVKYVAADFFGLPHEAETARLYAGDGHGGFSDVAQQAGLTAVSQPMGANFGDLDHDGWLDIYLGTGYPEYEALMPNLVYRNIDGKTFDDVTMPGGFGHLQKGHGVAFGDLNNDGTQDIYAQMGGAFPGDKFGNLLLKNPGFGNHWIGIKLIGQRSNRSAIGARIRVDVTENGTPRSIYKWVNSGGSFGANPLQQQIGIGTAKTVRQIEVFWPVTGQTQVVQDVPANQFLEMTEGVAGYRQRMLKPFEFDQGTMSDATVSMNHK